MGNPVVDKATKVSIMDQVVRDLILSTRTLTIVSGVK